MTIYRGFEVRQNNGKFSVWKDGHHVYTLETTQTEDAALSWIDAEKRREREVRK
jgi:VCBS repeat-containing protein